jgi:hypothetical protein
MIKVMIKKFQRHTIVFGDTLRKIHVDHQKMTGVNKFVKITIFIPQYI